MCSNTFVSKRERQHVLATNLLLYKLLPFAYPRKQCHDSLASHWKNTLGNKNTWIIPIFDVIIYCPHHWNWSKVIERDDLQSVSIQKSNSLKHCFISCSKLYHLQLSHVLFLYFYILKANFTTKNFLISPIWNFTWSKWQLTNKMWKLKFSKI